MLNIIMQTAPAAGTAPNPLGQLFFFIPLILIFYFLLIRPQSQRVKRHQKMLSEIVRGDTVVTNGGVIGKVTKVEDTELQVQIADGLKVKVMRSMIADVRNRTAPANDSEKPAKRKPAKNK